MGLVPLSRVLAANLTLVLREEGRSTSGSRGTRALRRSLVVAQVAFTFVLLAGAGLLLASFKHVLDVDPGFVAERVLTASVSLPGSRYADDDARRAFAEEALRRVRALPGVVSAGATDTIPFGDQHNDSVILAEGRPMKPGESLISPNAVDVTPGYFETMGVRLVRGRFFGERDGARSLRVVIVDETLAARFWPGEDPVGRRLYKPANANDLLAIDEKTVFFTVVGVVRDVRLNDLTEGQGSVGTYFFPMAQDTSRLVTFAIKTTPRPESLAAVPSGHGGGPRPGAAGLRREDDGRAIGRSAPEPPLARDAVPRLRRGRAAALRGRPLRRPRLPRGTAVAGDRHPHGGREQRPRRLRPRVPGGRGARGRRPRGRSAWARSCSAAAWTASSSASGRPTRSSSATALLLLVGVALLACTLPARRAMRIDPVTVLGE